MHVTLVLVKGRSNQANKQDTPQRPDSTQCNVSLTMIKDVTPKINDSLVKLMPCTLCMIIAQANTC